MAAMQASLGVSCPSSSLSKSSFLGGSSRLSRSYRGAGALVSSSSSRSLRIEAKKGEWLPGLASPAYLNGRLVYLSFNAVYRCAFLLFHGVDSIHECESKRCRYIWLSLVERERELMGCGFKLYSLMKIMM
mgnify:CR=1 FL=1